MACSVLPEGSWWRPVFGPYSCLLSNFPKGSTQARLGCQPLLVFLQEPCFCLSWIKNYRICTLIFMKMKQKASKRSCIKPHYWYSLLRYTTYLKGSPLVFCLGQRPTAWRAPQLPEPLPWPLESESKTFRKALPWPCLCGEQERAAPRVLCMGSYLQL